MALAPEEYELRLYSPGSAYVSCSSGYRVATRKAERVDSFVLIGAKTTLNLGISGLIKFESTDSHSMTSSAGKSKRCTSCLARTSFCSVLFLSKNLWSVGGVP